MDDSNEISTNNIEKRNQFIDMLFLNNINFNINLKNQYNEIFYKYITKIIQYIMNHNNDILQNSQLLELLQKFKSVFEFLQNTSNMLTELNNKVTNLKNATNIDLQNCYTSQDFNDFLQEYNVTIEKIYKNHLEFEKFMCHCATIVELNFNDSKNTNFIISNNANTEKAKPNLTESITNIDNQIKTITNTNNPKSIENELEEANTKTTEKPTNILENTLIISETSKKIILPYTLKDLENTLKTSNNKFSNIQEIIDKEYTVPYTNYSNPSISRFKEAYNLARNKEKLSMIQSFNLGMELLLNYNLHPAIISACKSLNELDIYLDYLENGETDKFKIFNIKFEVVPIIVK